MARRVHESAGADGPPLALALAVMLPPSRSDRETASRESAAFGLADLLEPDRGAPISRRGHGAPAMSVRLPAQLQDFAFADTINVMVVDDDGAPPPSGPIFVNDDDDAGAGTLCVNPLPYAPRAPRAAPCPRPSRTDMSELWARAAQVVSTPGRSSGALFFARRLVALWSFFQWSRTDLTRAALIGLTVFAVTGAVFASTTDLDVVLGGQRSEVRAAHTLDQHTGAKIVRRTKR